MKYYMNRIGVTKYQSQMAKVSISEATAEMESVINAINGSGLTDGEKETMVRDYAFGRITADEIVAAIAEATEQTEEIAITKEQELAA